MEKKPEPDVFIAYAREDHDFVCRLAEALTEAGKEVWFDREIEGGYRWREAIERALEAARNFVFVVSKASRESTHCARELSLAAELNKRVIPLLRETELPEQLPASLSEWQYVPAVGDALLDHIQPLVEIVDTDLAHSQTHRKLLVSALEWDRQGRPATLLLRGAQSVEAVDWLEDAGERRPAPTQLHREFVEASAEHDRRRRRRRLALTAGAVTLALLAVGLWVTVLRKARNEASLGIATRSQELRDRQLDVSLLLAALASEVADTPQSRAALLDAFADYPLLRTIIGRQPVGGLAVSADGRKLATVGCAERERAACSASRLRLWDTAEQRPLGEAVVIPGADVRQVAFGPRDDSVVVVDSEGRVGEWDPSKAASLNLREAEADLQRFSPVLSPRGTSFAATREDGALQIFSTDSAFQPRLLATGADPSGSSGRVLAYDNAGATLATARCLGADEDGCTREGIDLWLVQSGARFATLGAEDEGEIKAVAFGPDDRRLAAAGSTGSLRLWHYDDDLATWEEQEEIDRPDGDLAASALAFNPAGTRLAAAFGNEIFVRRLPGSVWIDRFAAHRSGIRGIRFIDDGLLVSLGCEARQQLICSRDEARLWDVDARGQIVEFWSVREGGRRAEDVAFPAGRLLIADSRGVVESRDSETGATVSVVDVSEGLDPRRIVLSPGGSHVTAILCFGGGIDDSDCPHQRLTIHDLRTGDAVGIETEAELDALAISPDGMQLVFRRPKGAMQWARRTDDGLVVREIEIKGLPEAWAFSPDGTLLAFGVCPRPILGRCRQGEVHLLRVESGEAAAIGPFEVPGMIESLAFDDLGGRLAVGGCAEAALRCNDGFVQLFDLKEGQAIGAPLSGHSGTVTSIAFDPDGGLLAAGSCRDYLYHQCTGGAVAFWDVASGEPIGPVWPAHRDDVTRLQFEPSGRRLASSGRDSQAGIWAVDPANWRRRACRMAGRSLTLDEQREHVTGWAAPRRRLGLPAACEAAGAR